MCDEIFNKHLEDYTIRTRFVIPEYLDDFYITVFSNAVSFAAFSSPNFDKFIHDTNISAPIHCFLLEYFLLVMREEPFIFCHFKFVQKYSNSLALTHQVDLEDSSVINLHVFPLLIKLVLTGNFLNYSFLLSTCVKYFDSFQNDQIFSSHCLQYFYNLKEKETSVSLEVFKLGLEFINLYIPRCDILSRLAIENFKNVALYKPGGYFLVALNPLKAVAEGKDIADLKMAEKVPIMFMDEIEFFENLENYLIHISFLKYETSEQFNARKLVFNALINCDKNILLLVNSGFITCFQAWILFQYTSLDDWFKLILKFSCYRSHDQRFKELYDLYIKD